MLSYKDSYFPAKPAGAWNSMPGNNSRYILWFCVFGFLMAFLELGQDVISSTLNGNQFYLTESLAYKLFWLLFAPFSIGLAYLLKKIHTWVSGVIYATGAVFSLAAVTLSHLMLFSLFLFGISNLIHANPWSLPFLIIEKLSTRLYIALSVYMVFSVAYYFLSIRSSKKEADHRNSSDTLPVKNGKNTVLVDHDQIQWIRSDGPYLYIYTPEKKHVIVDSLKHIITTLPANFKRIHRSVIVNVDIIQKLKSRGNGDYDVITEDGEILRLSRNYAKPLKRMLL